MAWLLPEIAVDRSWGKLVFAMSNSETRHVDRDSLFLLAQLRLEGADEVYRVKVRNLSAGGMMADGDVLVQRGMLVHVDLRNIGWVEGTVAWRQENRFGIAFVDEIDPKRAREPVTGSVSSPAPREQLRKI